RAARCDLGGFQAVEHPVVARIGRFGADVEEAACVQKCGERLLVELVEKSLDFLVGKILEALGCLTNLGPAFWFWVFRSDGREIADERTLLDFGKKELRQSFRSFEEISDHLDTGTHI